MSTSAEEISREDVFDGIADAVIFGNLGLFVGSGFSKAVMDDPGDESALSWKELMLKCALELKIKYSKLDTEGNSYPEIATQLCKLVSTKENITYEESVLLLKRKIAEITCLYPSVKKRSEYRQYLEALEPNWIITTNYDHVIETVLTGKAYTLSPVEQLVAPKGLIPVYHLHGVRSQPETIVITQEDYISLFRPNQYTQQRLILTLTESLTLMIGYGLGDMNVRIAVDWSNNVFNDKRETNESRIIQLLHRENPKADPYIVNKVVVLEFDDLGKLMKELCKAIESSKKDFKSLQKELHEIDEALRKPAQRRISEFVDDSDHRMEILRLLRENDNAFISGFIELLLKAIELTRERARPQNAFDAYDQNLKLLLDILENIELHTAPPELIITVAEDLNRLSRFIGPGFGESHAAYRTWKSRQNDLPPSMRSELVNISKAKGWTGLKQLLEIE